MTIRNLIIGAALAATLSTGALAGNRVEQVPHRDLNLASAAGQAELQSRLDAAAHRVCRFEDNGQISRPADEQACVRQTRKTVDVKFAALVDSQIQRGG